MLGIPWIRKDLLEKLRAAVVGVATQAPMQQQCSTVLALRSSG